MEIGQLIINIIGLLLVLAGVILIYDARIITKNFFSFGDQNEGSLGLKIAGVIIFLIGSGILIFL